MGRYYSGDLEGKFDLGQRSDCLLDFGGVEAEQSYINISFIGICWNKDSSTGGDLIVKTIIKKLRDAATHLGTIPELITQNKMDDDGTILPSYEDIAISSLDPKIEDYEDCNYYNKEESILKYNFKIRLCGLLIDDLVDHSVLFTKSTYKEGFKSQKEILKATNQLEYVSETLYNIYNDIRNLTVYNTNTEERKKSIFVSEDKLKETKTFFTKVYHSLEKLIETISDCKLAIRVGYCISRSESNSCWLECEI